MKEKMYKMQAVYLPHFRIECYSTVVKSDRRAVRCFTETICNSSSSAAIRAIFEAVLAVSKMQLNSYF